MAEFSENRHISILINMSCKVSFGQVNIYTRFTRFTNIEIFSTIS